MNPNDVAPLLGMVAVCATATVITGMVLRARAKASQLGRGTSPDIEARLARIEQAVDAIAVEVERVSEGQRFTTKLLAERGEQGVIPRRTGDAR
jgi:hypothetical protein